MAAARSLASQGARAFDAGRWGEALDLFTRAESLVHAPPHVLYMARSAEKLGRLVQAREFYIRIIREKLPNTAPKAFRDAQTAANTEASRIEPRIASIVIQVKAPQGVTPNVTMDGTPITAALLGVPFPVDPGQHVLLATAPGMSTGQAEVTLAESERRDVELVLDPTAAATPVPGTDAASAESAGAPPPDTQGDTSGPTIPPPIDAGGDGSGWMRTGAYVGLGVGVVGIAAGTVFALRSRSKHSDADDLMEKECSRGCAVDDPRAVEIASLDDSARKAQTGSIVSYVVGGVGLASGVTLYLLSHRSDSPEHAADIHWTPWIGFGSAGVSGSF